MHVLNPLQIAKLSAQFPRQLVLATLALLLLIPGVSSGGVLEKLFAPKAELWPRWSEHDAADQRRIDHTAWMRFLDRHRSLGQDGVARVAYSQVGASDRAALAAYVAALSSVRISGYSRAEQFAYWVNLYNALTVQVVLEHYPVVSIRDIDISPGFLADGPWRKRLVAVEGEALSLDDIEHRILRPIWQDPRVHYAVNCASIGCPNLPAEAFTADNTEALLQRAARDYVNHPRGASVTGESLTLSSIYSWFEPDFAVDGGVLAHIRGYAHADLAAELQRFERARDFEYDWSLNDADAPRR